MSKDSELVYSTDPEKNKRCEKCRKLLSDCRCGEEASVDISQLRFVLRLERAHRGGKDVTVIDRLPPSESFLKDLSKKLKKRCGAGGTYKISEGKGIIEIQGDKREKVQKELEKMGISKK
ncbi:MAG: translation initiation factor [Chitinispirillaceae bacterium]